MDVLAHPNPALEQTSRTGRSTTDENLQELRRRHGPRPCTTRPASVLPRRRSAS